MKRRATDKTARQARFLRASVRMFMQSKELSQMTVQNEYGAISVARDMPPQSATHAIGFDIGNAVEGDFDE